MTEQSENLTPHPFPFEHPGSFRENNGGEQWHFYFTNGYGASVIRFSGSYGGELGLWELGVLGADGRLTYDTPIADDVIGHLDEQAVALTLDRICRLPCTNGDPS